MPFALGSKVLVDCTGQEQDDNNSGCNPDRPVQVRVSLEHIEEVLARVDGRGAAAEHLVCVNIEGLRVKGEGP